MKGIASTTAPATAAEFKREVTRAFRTANPGSSILFTSRVRRFPGRANQPEGTVSFAVEFRAHLDGKVEEFIADSFRLGGVDGNHRVGRGSISASAKGAREVWA